jgi:hypothetical protein
VDDDDLRSTSMSTVESTSYVAVNLNVRGQRRRQTVEVNHRLRPNCHFLFLRRVRSAPGKTRHKFRGIKLVSRPAYKHACDVTKHT